MDFPPYILSIVAIVLFMIYVLQRDTHLFEKIHRKLLGSESRPLKSSTDPTATIQALWDFDITTTPPISYRPYEFQGHVTMGIQQRKRQDWIRMDNGYSQRIRDRKEPLTAQPHYTIGTGPLLDPAIEELYHEIMVDYLPKRYPTLFSEKGGIVQNRVTGSSYPLSTSNLSPKSMLELLGENVEEDFYFMCPDAEDGQFRLRGYVTCFPGGFLSPERVGESVREIHRPVPGYEEKIGKSVDRYSKRMVPGQFIGRINWSLQVDSLDLFRIDGNNFYPEAEDQTWDTKRSPRLDQAYLRVEHQTLCALPKSRAIIFCVRSYMTPLEQMHAKGEGPALAAAIESMPEKLGEYKMRQFWGEKVLPWLRSGADGSKTA